MSTSTIFIKKPLNCRQSLALIVEKYKEYSTVLTIILWTITGLYSASKSNFNSNITGVTLSFNVFNLLIMSIASVLLYKGLSERNMLLLIPWIIATIYSLYYNHYLGLLSILESMKNVKKLSWLPWSNLIVNIALLVIRVTLTIRLFQYCVHLWVKNKLKELKDKL